MDLLLAQLKAEPIVLASIVKPLVMLAVMGPWAWLAGRLDKDADYFHLPRRNWGMAHVGAGLLAFAVMLLVPIFIIGLVLALMILIGEVMGYLAYRNKNVAEDEKWSGLDMLRKAQKDRAHRADVRAREQADVKLFNKDEVQLDIPHGSDPRTPAFDLFQKMLVFAVERGADRLEMTVDKEKAAFRVRIDGVKYNQPAPPPELGLQVIQYLKENAGMDADEQRRKQNGKMWVEVEDRGRNTLELMTAGSTRARQLTIDIDPEGRNNKKLDELGLIEPKQLEAVRELVQSDSGGVVLFSSPPQQGTTTTAYAILKEHDPYTSSVMTYEQQTPYPVEGVNHNLFPEGASKEQIVEQFGSLMRRDPNVMLLSQLVSPEMAQAIVPYAEDTRVYVPLPAKDTVSGLKLWLKLVGDARQGAESLSAVISQRLMRKLCVVCRAPYHPDEAAIKKLNLTKAKFDHLYKASGKVVMKEDRVTCPTCQGLGYRGRVAVFELMIIDREARSLIASNERERLMAHFRKQKMVFLQEAALAKVVEGVCDIKEVTRVISEIKED